MVQCGLGPAGAATLGWLTAPDGSHKGWIVPPSLLPLLHWLAYMHACRRLATPHHSWVLPGIRSGPAAHQSISVGRVPTPCLPARPAVQFFKFYGQLASLVRHIMTKTVPHPHAHPLAPAPAPSSASASSEPGDAGEPAAVMQAIRLLAPFACTAGLLCIDGLVF